MEEVVGEVLRISSAKSYKDLFSAGVYVKKEEGGQEWLNFYGKTKEEASEDIEDIEVGNKVKFELEDSKYGKKVVETEVISEEKQARLEGESREKIQVEGSIKSEMKEAVADTVEILDGVYKEKKGSNIKLDFNAEDVRAFAITLFLQRRREK